MREIKSVSREVSRPGGNVSTGIESPKTQDKHDGVSWASQISSRYLGYHLSVASPPPSQPPPRRLGAQTVPLHSEIYIAYSRFSVGFRTAGLRLRLCIERCVRRVQNTVFT